MERTHGELGARLADGLSGDDADGLARVDGTADSEVDAVAVGADAALSVAGEDGADLDFMDAVLLEDGGVLADEHVAAVKDKLACRRVADIVGGIASVDAVAERLDDLALVIHGRDNDTIVSAAVVLADDDIL